MAKKKQKNKSSSSKKKGGDARGYSSGTPSRMTPANIGSSAQNVAITSKTHHGLVELLDGLKEEEEGKANRNEYRSETNTTNVSATDEVDFSSTNKRLLSKITNIFDSLTELKFTESQIESALVSISHQQKNNDRTKSDYSVEACLDWLCLHEPSDALPSLFTEVNVRISAMGGEGEITVEHAETTRSTSENDNGEKNHNRTMIIAENEKFSQWNQTKFNETNKSDEDNNTKAWILNQYQFEDEDDNLDDSNNVNHGQNAAVNEEEEEVVLSPEEKRLNELEHEIHQEKASLNDDVANYMRSKQEIADLKKRVKKLESQAKGLRAKVAKIKAIRESAATNESAGRTGEEKNGNMQEEEDDDDGMFSLFSDDHGDNNPPPKNTTNNNNESSGNSNELSKPTDEMEDDKRKYNINTTSPSIPDGWTGKTPKKILEEWCQKQKCPKPQFHKFGACSKGCRLVVKNTTSAPKAKHNTESDDKTVVIELPGPFYSYTDAQQFASTEALYELSPDLPLYRLFPPTFRNLWQSWVRDEEETKRRMDESDRIQKEEKMKNLLRKILLPLDGQVSVLNTKPTKVDTPPQAKEEVLDSWEDDDHLSHEYDDDTWTNQSSPSSASSSAGMTPSDLGIKIRNEFMNRQTSVDYTTMAAFRSSLPIQSYKNQILDCIRTNQVTVLCAETGAGKTTQCPQFLLEESLLEGFGDKVSILCTQPRRISAMSVAERVADEMCESIGETIGYHIRMESRRSTKTKLLFCTTGVVLRRLQDDPNLTGVTHVVVDEVHERQWQIDFLLIALRRMLNTTRKDLKVILMSATLDAELFCDFFNGCPMVSVPGRTFPVSEYYLEDLLDATDHVIEEGSRNALPTKRQESDTTELWVTGRGGEKRREVISMDTGPGLTNFPEDDYYAGYKLATRRSMARVDETVLNYDLIEDLLTILLIDHQNNDAILPPNKMSNQKRLEGAVLIFLPGIGEIKGLHERLRGSRAFGNSQRFDIIPMHSSLSPKDQKRAFRPIGKGCHKIILATNIAETSVTIPDVVCVIDSGLVREIRRNKRSGTTALVADWCSRASAKQRSGRAGRVQPGICCKLFSSRTANSIMKKQSMPELQRVPLEEVCLSILASKLADSCMEFLLQAPQPPSEEAVRTALDVLEEVGAIEASVSNQVTNPPPLQRSETLTPLGVHLAKIPVHVRLGKMLIFGALFGCLDQMLTIAASLSSKSPFSRNVEAASQAHAAHRSFAHPTSDFLAVCNVWAGFSAAWTMAKITSSSSITAARRFCDKNYLNWTALLEIRDMRNQFLELLRQIGFVHNDKNSSSSLRDQNFTDKDDCLPQQYTRNSHRENVVSAVICAGLYPNLAHATTTTATQQLPELWHKEKERVYFHSTSINHNKKRLESEWIAFHEKFETNRVYITATSLIRPFAILLFGGSIVVKHTSRKVIVDDWIELNIAAQTGVMFRELRKSIQSMLEESVEEAGRKNATSDKNERMIIGIVNLLSSEETTCGR